jgi:predicted AAA+ superfamily ATPase
MPPPAAPSFERPQAAVLADRLREPRRFIQVVTGARQVGKTTLVGQVLDALGRPHVMVSADAPTVGDTAWLSAQWERGRAAAADAGKTGAILVLDEIQKISRWSDAVKQLWDEDTRARRALRVVLLGSSPLLMQQGLSDSLAGRFETVHLPHWSFVEMRAAFGFSLDDYLYFGGYPGAAPLARANGRDHVQRWRRYLLDSLIETTISRDVLLMSRVDKPALLRRLFALGCKYSGQIVALNKVLGQLHDAGNTTTLAHYLELLGGAGMLIGLQKYSGKAVRQRASSPKFQVLNTALMTAQAGLSPADVRQDPVFRGRLIESAIGAHLANAAAAGACELFYWREQNEEVDFVLRAGRVVVAIEVKSGRPVDRKSGLATFVAAFKPTRSLIVGTDGIPIGEFLTKPVDTWLAR